MADWSNNSPRAIALIDLPDLQAQVKRLGGLLSDDLTPVVEQIEAGLAAFAAGDAGANAPALDCVYVYAPAGAACSAEGDLGAMRLLMRPRGGGPRECQACNKCVHCQVGPLESRAKGRENPMAADLMRLARDDVYDWAVIVTTDTWLISIVMYLQAHGRTIIHACFPPIAADLTKECRGSIDLRPLVPGAA